MDSVTITREQMEDAFQYLSTVKHICDSLGEEDKNGQDYQKYLYEYCGILTAFNELGIMNEYFCWSATSIE